MPSSADLYPLVLDWLRSVFAVAPPPSAAQSALAHLVTAVLLSQRLRPSALMRALLSPVPVPARQRYKRLARAWTRPWLAPAALTPHLVRAVLAGAPPREPPRPGGWAGPRGAGGPGPAGPPGHAGVRRGPAGRALAPAGPRQP